MGLTERTGSEAIQVVDTDVKVLSDGEKAGTK